MLISNSCHYIILTRSYPKDKIHREKEVGDDTSIKRESVCELSQCPDCRQYFKGTHKCHDIYHTCTICNMSLDKKGKEVIFGRTRYISMRYKKHFNLINSKICWNCCFAVTKWFQKQSDPKGN